MAYFDTNPEFTQEIRKLEPTDRAHADVFNALLELLVKNEMYLKQAYDNMILYGPADTYIPPGSTLFVVDEGENLFAFRAAAFSNMEIRASPDGSQGLVQSGGASGSTTADSSGTISGKITVAGEPEPDAVFFAQTNQ